MNKELKKEWITELRSGNYTQGKGRLKSRGGYCCLGVLADICVKKGLGKWEEHGLPEDNDRWYYVSNENKHDVGGAILPYSIKLYADLTSAGGELVTPIFKVHNQEATNLAALNDSFDYNFDQIADVIEEQF